MKLEIIEGCLNYSFTVDGDNIYNIDNLIIFYLKTSFLGKRKVRFR